MYCQKCGNAIADDADFCPKCGTKVKKAENAGEERSSSQIKAEVHDATASSNKKNNKKVTIAVIALVAIAVVGVVIKSIGGIIGSSVLSSYKIPTDVEVIATSVSGNYGYATIKNTGEKVIKDFTLAVVGYDASGNAISLGGNTLYRTFEFSTANVLPGAASALENTVYLNNSVKYMDVTVSEIVYKDGSTWKTDGLDAWAKDVSDEFSVENHKQTIEGMKTKAVLAEENPYIKITGTSKYNNNRYSTNEEFSLEIQNVGDKTIKKFDVIVLQYDSNGYAINVSPYSFVTTNGRTATVDPANIDPNESGGWTWSLFMQGECDSYKVLPYHIEFKDGTVWSNENALPWILYNEDKR